MEQVEKIEDDKPEVEEVTIGLSAKVSVLISRKSRSSSDQSSKPTPRSTILLISSRSWASAEHNAPSVKPITGGRANLGILAETLSAWVSILSLARARE